VALSLSLSLDQKPNIHMPMCDGLVAIPIIRFAKIRLK
jgi:hypothetical protein